MMMTKMSKSWYVWLSAVLVVCACTTPRAAAQLDWSTEVVDPNTGDADSYDAGTTTVRLDSAGNPWISYVSGPIGGSSFHLKLAVPDGTAWTTSIVDTDTYGYACLALDSSDIAHICFRRSEWYDQGVLWYARGTPGDWAVEMVDPTLGLRGPSIAVDSLDRPHIAYESGAYPNRRLKYAQWTGSAWDIQDVETGGQRDATSIALDSQDLPHICYVYCCVDGVRQVRYAHWDGVDWQFDTIGTNITPYSTSIAVDSNDQPHIAHTLGGLEGISYAYQTGDEWQTELISTGRIWHARLALGSDDEPRVVYYHADDGTLVFAMRQAGDWTIQVVDDSPSGTIRIGRFPSIAVGAGDALHVSYYSHGSGRPNELKYAHAAPPCFGDLDGDGDVDLTDLATLLANYGTPSGAEYEDGDLDGDGDVDLTDLAMLLANYGTSCL